VLVRAVVVGGDRARPDVRGGSDLGVSEVAHVVLLDPPTEAAVLDLGVVPDLGVVADDRARPQVGEGTDGDPVADLGALEDAGDDATVATDRRVLDPRALPTSSLPTRSATQDDVRFEGDVRRQLDGRLRYTVEDRPSSTGPHVGQVQLGPQVPRPGPAGSGR
jgi:hypothetical protein